jgi:hypothetical protein
MYSVGTSAPISIFIICGLNIQAGITQEEMHGSYRFGEGTGQKYTSKKIYELF